MRKTLLVTFMVFAVIAGAAFFIVGRYTDRVIDPYVRSLLSEFRPMNHRLEYRDLKVNLLKGEIIVKGTKIYPDSSLDKSQRLWIDIKVSKIFLTEVNIKNILLNKSLHIGDLVMREPTVELHLPGVAPLAVIEDVGEESVRQEKAPLLTSISLNQVILSGGDFRLYRSENLLASSPDINLMFTGIHLRKNAKDEPVGYSYDDIRFLLSGIALNPESGLYNMSLASLSGDKRDSTIVLKGFKMIPKYDKQEHTTHLKYQKERFDIQIGEMEIKGLGYLQMLSGKPLHLNAIRIDSIQADIYKDKNLPIDSTLFPLFYNESFLNVPIPVRLDTLEITGSKLYYNELAAGRTEIGSILLEQFALQAYDLTNVVSPEDTVDNVMRLKAQARIMGEGNMNLEVVLPLEGNLRNLECYGSVGAMSLRPLNAMLEPSLNIKFNGGKVNRMTFHFTGDNKKTDGWMEFLYNDLDVVLLKKEPDKEWGFISWLANTVTLSNNPAPGRELKIVSIGCERDPNKGMINYVWRTLQSGMIHTILPINKFQINKKQAEKKESGAKDKKKKDKQ